MRKLSILLSILFLFGCSNSDRAKDEIVKKENYYLSDEACAFIFYDVEGTPPLEIKDRTINYHFDEQNILKTSSSYDFGWASEESSGFRSHTYYKPDGSTIPLGEEPGFYNGEKNIDGIKRNYTFIHINGQESCFAPIKETYQKNN